MLAAKLISKGRFAIQAEEHMPILSPGEVLLKVAYVGICGSDLHYFRQGAIGDQVIEYPFIIGHEAVAVVETTDNEVADLKRGDRVVLNPAISCGRCDQCRAGRPHTCRRLKFLGCPGQLEGCFEEYITMPAPNCFTLAEDLVPLGVLVEPLAIALYAVQLAGPVKEKSLAVFGCGSIGLSLIYHSSLQKPRIIVATDKVENRLRAARRFGAAWVGNPESQDVVHELIQLEPEQFDYAFDCCGDQEALNQALSILKPGGRLIIVGIPEKDSIFFDPHLLRRKEISIINVRRQNNFFPQAIEFLQLHKETLRSLITHEFSLKEIQTAFELCSRYEDGVIKAVIALR